MITPAPFSARRARKGAFGRVMRTTTVMSSGLSIPATSLKTSKLTAPVSGLRQRSKDYFTSAEVMVEPSWNVTPARRRKV